FSGWQTDYNNFLDGGVLSWNYLVAFSLFIIASITDALDGYLARKNNEISTFGKLMDPIADKVLINSVIIIFAINKYVPAWVAVFFILRDTLVDGLRMIGSSKGVNMSAKFLGKQKTIWQFIGIFLIFIIPGYCYGSNWWVLIPLYISVLFSFLSLIYYYYTNWNLIF
ncbi:MAG: CDP-diacylglycerol--glycerol-3-phosphate 3-phosphatidyltransferase, partial [Mycoplasmataceae bacterium]|nr:CDP-diacylglycerol--glycerol-3-phosphate 3-phosphatidyltransferase [Mycoplasmataceae bacterium]